MDSGVAYNFDVKIPSRKKKKELASFQSLSKSGKVVNVYNALLLAAQMTQK